MAIKDFLTEAGAGNIVITNAQPIAENGGAEKKKKKNKKKNKGGEKLENGYAKPEEAEKKMSSGNEATEESPLKPMKKQSVEELKMEPKATPAPKKASRRDATLNMCEKMLANSTWLKGKEPS